MSTSWPSGYTPDVTDKVVIVTGANSGLGLEIARVLATNGARVLMACRNEEKAERAATTLRDSAPRGELDVRTLDLADLESVRALAADVLRTEGRLDLLVNNAGLMATDESRTADGFEMQLGVNHLGHFALTAKLMPLLLTTPGSRVVTMSSMGHRMGRMRFDDLMFERNRYYRWPAYFQSKLANLMFTAELQRRLAAAGASTVALAAHPGATSTDLGGEGTGITNRLMAPLFPIAGQPVEGGALPMLRAATDPAARGGEYYGPRWLMSGRPVPETPSRRARRPADAAKLWAASEELTQTTFDLGRAS